MTDRTAILWIDGERYVLDSDGISTMLEIGRRAETVPRAWDDLVTWLENNHD